MYRFTEQVRGGESVRDVKQRYPETEPVFAQFGLRASCYDCSIHQAAQQAGAAVDDLLLEVNEAIQQARSVAV